MNIEKNIKKAKQLLEDADAILITAGAGMSVDSGLPDFRGNKGFWKEYPKIKKLGLEFEDIANPMWFREDPSLAWAFYGHRLQLYSDVTPHEGFKKLLDLCVSKKFGTFVYTSNVDGQFQKSGFSEDQIVECHGSIHKMQCINDCQEKLWDSKNINIEINDEFRANDPLPKCPYCKNIARPNIVMFYDSLWNASRVNKQLNSYESWLEKIKKNNAKLLILEIGAGTAIPTIRQLSEDVAIECNVPLIRINPRDSFAATVGLDMRALTGICAIISKKS